MKEAVKENTKETIKGNIKEAVRPPVKKTVNRPLANTFGWLQAGAKTIELRQEIQKYSYTLAPGEHRTLFIDGDPGAAEYEITLARDARLDLIQLRDVHSEAHSEKPSAHALSYNNVRVTCGDRAYFAWYRAVIGRAGSREGHDTLPADVQDARTYDNCSVILQGTESVFEANICYRLGGAEKYDLNCEAIHLARRSQSEISASGVLDGRAVKLMRGTIDFQTGCSGSVGNESEDVLLLSEQVRNQSVPVILCGEEDVVGNHGASIGRPDEDLLFYMQTRGIDEQTACEMLAHAKLDAVIRRIPDAEIQEMIQNRIRNRIQEGK